MSRNINGRIILLIRLVIAAVLGLVALFFPSDGESFLRYLRITFFAIACVIAGFDLLISGTTKAVNGVFFNEQLFFSLAVILAWVISKARLSALLSVLIFQLGMIFFKYANDAATKNIPNLRDVLPDKATLVYREKGKNSSGASEKEVPASGVRPDEYILVKAGEGVPLDGVVVSGESSVNTFAITGGVSALPVHKGSVVLAGFMNLDNDIIIKAEKVAARSAASRIIEWVSSGKNLSKTEIWVRRLEFFLPVAVILLSIFIYFVPVIFKWDNMRLQKSAVTIFAVACPAAITLTIPKLFKNGVAKATSLGVLFRDPVSLEKTADITSIYIEHKGGLTRDEFRVVSIETEGVPEQVLLRLAMSALKNPHCVMPTYKSALEERYWGKIDRSIAYEDRCINGMVVEIKGNIIAVGDAELMYLENIRTGDDSGMRDVLYVAINNKYAGRIVFADALRPDSAEAVYRLNSSDVKPILLTDEPLDEAAELARSLGMDKLYQSIPRQTKESMLSLDNTAYVGYDAQLLEIASVGITMAEPGLEFMNKKAENMPEVTVFSESLMRISDAHRLARSVRDISRGSFTLTFAVKAAIILLALIGWCPFWLAITAEVCVKYLCGSRRI